MGVRRTGPARAVGNCFPPACATPRDRSRGNPGLPAFASRNKTVGLPALLRSASAAALRLAVQARSVRRLFASKAAMGAAAIHGAAAMAIDQDTDFEPIHASSPTTQVIHELQVHGYHPHQDEPDPRALPDENAVRGALADIFEIGRAHV